MYSQAFLVGRRLSEHLRFHLKLWGCISWGQHSEFLLEFPGGCRANQASGHWAPWVGSLKVHSTHCRARGIPRGNTRFQTAMRKTKAWLLPCAMDLRYCLRRVLQGRAARPEFATVSRRAVPARCCASTTLFLAGATDQIKHINCAFGMQSMSRPEWSPRRRCAARQEIGEREVFSQVDSLTVRTSIHQLGRRRAAASVLNLQQRAMTFQFTKVQRHSTQIYQQLLDNIVKLPTFQTLPASGGFLFAQASLTGNSELQWAHKFNWFYFHLRHEECHRKLLEVPLLSTQSSHGTTLAKCRISPATGHWLTALDARHWHCTDCSFSSTLRRAPF